MNRPSLAAKLILAATTRERTRLLSNNSRLADADLARGIKEICYSAWTAEPTKARRAERAINALSHFVEDREIDAYAAWVSGISDITKGRLESAADNLQAASRAFRDIGSEKESALPMVAMLIPLAMLGRYDEAYATGKTALRVFDKHGDELAAGKVEMNLSNILSRQGLYRRSEKLGLAALSRFKKIGETGWRTMAENDLANTYTELNDFRRAEEFYSTALEGARAASMLVTQAEIEGSLGSLSLFRGRYAEALSFFERARAKYEGLGMPHQSAVAELEIAGIYSELNLLKESVEIAKRAAKTLQRLKMQGEEARARADLGRSLIALGDVAAARRELKKAARLFAEERNGNGSTSVILTLAKIGIANASPSAATGLVDMAERAARAGDDQLQKLAAALLRCEQLLAAGQAVAANRRLPNILLRARRFDQPQVEQAAHNLSGKIAVARGDLAKAEKSFSKAVEIVESLRSPLPAEEYRMAFFSAKLEPYENLATLYLDQGRTAEAFELFEQARSRALIDAMEGGGGAAAGSSPLARRINEIRDELNWFYNRSARAAADEAAKIRGEIRKRELGLSDLLRRAGSTAGARRAATPGVRRRSVLLELQQELGAARAFIEYVQVDGRISAFVVTDTDINFFPHVAEHNEIERLLSGLQFQFDSLRYGPESMNAFQTLLKAKADAYLGRLHDKLLAPLIATVGDRNVVIAPVSLLHYVPFHALRGNGRYVIEQREVSYAPSGGVWARLPADTSVRSPKSLIIGFADEKIPLVDVEIAELAKTLPGADILSGDSATFGSYKRLAPGYDLLHFACHGQFRPDNPLFSSLHLADGWVTVGDICAQRLSAKLVTLSACETGLNEIAGGEEIIGLARGFLSAGAASIVMSLWTVNDTATAGLMSNFYRCLQRGETVSASLRTAQLKLIGDGQHPFYWSPFIVIGK